VASSTISLTQFPRSGIAPEVAQPTRGVSFQTSPNLEVHHPRSGQSKKSKLLPSAAELSGRLRHYHSAHMSVDRLPSMPAANARASHFHSYSTDALPLSTQSPPILVSEPQTPTRFSQATTPYKSSPLRESGFNEDVGKSSSVGLASPIRASRSTATLQMSRDDTEPPVLQRSQSSDRLYSLGTVAGFTTGNPELDRSLVTPERPSSQPAPTDHVERFPAGTTVESLHSQVE
jgi:hypothetical protein